MHGLTIQNIYETGPEKNRWLLNLNPRAEDEPAISDFAKQAAQTTAPEPTIS